jgi:hypothetical protein
MFPSAKTRFASAARRGFDLAIEFATLGEYRLPAAPQPVPAGTPSTPAVVAAPVRPRPSRVRPATAAARRLQPIQPQPQRQRISAHSGMRALAFRAHGARRPRQAGRSRAGAARPRPQPCLVAEAGGSAAMDS